MSGKSGRQKGKEALGNEARKSDSQKRQ